MSFCLLWQRRCTWEQGSLNFSSVDPAIEADKAPSSTLSRMAKLCSAFERWPLIIESRGPEHSAIRAAWTYNGVLDDEGEFQGEILQILSVNVKAGRLAVCYLEHSF